MGNVAVSSARVRSLLSNRHRTFADLASVHTDRDLTALEHDNMLLALDELEALARYFKKTWPYLLIDDPEPPFAVERDHRRRVGPVEELSDDLLEALRASDEQLTIIIDLVPDELMWLVEHDLRLPASGDAFSASGRARAEAAGAALRTFLGVTADDQVRPHDEYAALRTWIDALDHRGIYVAQRKINDASVRAFSLYREGHALAVIDTGDSGWARCFSLVHEVVHLQMRSAGICDLDEHSSIERWCNAVAAAALMPRDVLARADLAPLHGHRDIADNALRSAAKLIGVSQFALLLRLRDLGEMTIEEFEGFEERWSQRRGAERDSGGGDYYLNKVVRVGRRFTRQVLGAYDDAVLTATEAASALDVREHQLSGLRRWL